ncbi:SdpI family protein [Hymenobacter sp. B81]|uniref:SdpI family protein n=1 Tax=Hymenobacter sp. B81 TaxID=3344878 RepID=UPI0037DD69A6
MNRKLSFWYLSALLVALVPALYLVREWSALPAQVPVQFDLDGQPSRYGGREALLLLCLGLPLGCWLLMSWLPRFDPKRRLLADSLNYQKLTFFLVMFLAVLACEMLYANTRGRLAPELLGYTLSGFFVLLGNYLTTVPPNYFVGIRTPWTLESPAVWTRAHRLGGRLFVGAGLLGLLLTALLPAAWATPAVTGLVAGAALTAAAASFVYFRRENGPAPVAS